MNPSDAPPPSPPAGRGLASQGGAAPQPSSTMPAGSLGGDLLYGADEIAGFLYGDATQRRKVYNLVETGRLPHFRLGATICARRSVLLAWIAEQESG